MAATSLKQVRQSMDAALLPDLNALQTVPKKSGKISSVWDYVSYVNPGSYYTSWRQNKIIATTHEHLHEKIEDVADKITALQFPDDVTKREEYRTFFEKETNINAPQLKEIEQGLELLMGREEPTKVQTLIDEWKAMRQTIDAKRKEMEGHFLLQAQRQHIHSLAKELGSMIALLQKAAPAEKKDSLNAVAKSAQYYQTIDNKGMIDPKAGVDGFKKLMVQVTELRLAVFPKGEGESPELTRMNRNVQTEARKLEQPELLVTELQKRASQMSVEQAQQIIRDMLPNLVDSAYSVEHKGMLWNSAFLDENLVKEEKAFLQSLQSTDLAKLTPQRLSYYAEETQRLIRKGLNNNFPESLEKQMSHLERPLTVLAITRQALKAQAPVKSLAQAPVESSGNALFQATLQIAQAQTAKTPVLAEGGEATARAAATQIVDQNTVRKTLADDFSKLIDQAFNVKLPSGKGVLQSKLTPPERDTLQASKERAQSLITDPKFKTFVQNALNIIDQGFLKEVPPFKTTPKPEALAASIKALRDGLNQLP